jgi:hypothetical protein
MLMGLLLLVHIAHNTALARQHGVSVSNSAGAEPGNSQLTILGISIGADTLKTVQEKLGSSKPCLISEHLTTLGYRVGNGTLLFESSDIGGGDITGLVLKLSQGHPACDLPAPRTVPVVLGTDGGVHLGMTQSEFTKIFGSPQKTTPNGNFVYQWLRTEKLSKAKQRAADQALPGAGTDGAVDILTTIEARFSAKGLTYFYISRIESL